MSKFKKACPIHVRNAEYGCILNPEKFVTEGGIIPINDTITWYFDTKKSSDSIRITDAREGIQRALSLIQAEIRVKLVEVFTRSEAQIVLGFYKNEDPALPQQFETSTLAYAFLGNATTAFNLVGDVFLNDQHFNWALEASSTRIDLIKVCVHEILHSLGLGHQTFDSRGILYPSYSPSFPIKFTQDTLDGLHSMYGSNKQEPRDVCSIIKELFPTKRKLNRLNEPELVKLANYYGIQATTDDYKQDTLNKVWNKLISN